ncbi:DUF1829 domain-containing protein [Virgibacillus natechei]
MGLLLKDIKENYLDWLKDNTKLTEVMNNSIEISSPFLDSYDENIKIYISKDKNGFILSDDGYTFWNLNAYGMAFKKNTSRHSMLHRIINIKGLKFDEQTKEIYIKANQNTIGSAMHTLIQGLINISNLSITNTKNIKGLFYDNVYNYFSKNNEIFDFFPDIDLQGKSQLTHKFDYMFNMKDKKKKLVKLVNQLNINAVQSILFSWEDTYTQRLHKYNEDLSMATIINDENKNINQSYLAAFEEYNVQYVFWSEKDSIHKNLSIH